MRTGPADTLPTTAEVVVIGGGIVGAAVAFHLARAGITDVVVVERDGLAGAASGKPIGGLRAQFSDRLNALLALRSLELYAALGADMDHQRVGYLFLLRDAEHVARFEAGVELQHEVGIPSVMLDAAEARERCPRSTPRRSSRPPSARSTGTRARWTPRGRTSTTPGGAARDSSRGAP